MPAMTNEPWRGFAKVQVDGGAGNRRSYTASVSTVTPDSSTGDQQDWDYKAGDAVTLRVAWDQNGVPAFNVANEIKVYAYDVDTGALLGQTTVATIGQATGAVTRQLRFTETPFDALAAGGDDRAGMLELVVEASRAQAVAWGPVDSRGNGTPPAGATINWARGYFRAKVQLLGVRLSRDQPGGVAADALYAAETMYHRATLDADWYGQQALTIAHVQGGSDVRAVAGDVSSGRIRDDTWGQDTKGVALDGRVNNDYAATPTDTFLEVRLPTQTFGSVSDHIYAWHASLPGWTVDGQTYKRTAPFTVDPRVDFTSLMQVNDSTFGTPPLSKDTTVRSVSEMGFLASRTSRTIELTALTEADDYMRHDPLTVGGNPVTGISSQVPRYGTGSRFDGVDDYHISSADSAIGARTHKAATVFLRVKIPAGAAGTHTIFEIGDDADGGKTFRLDWEDDKLVYQHNNYRQESSPLFPADTEYSIWVRRTYENHSGRVEVKVLSDAITTEAFDTPWDSTQLPASGVQAHVAAHQPASPAPREHANIDVFEVRVWEHAVDEAILDIIGDAMDPFYTLKPEGTEVACWFMEPVAASTQVEGINDATWTEKLWDEGELIGTEASPVKTRSLASQAQGGEDGWGDVFLAWDNSLPSGTWKQKQILTGPADLLALELNNSRDVTLAAVDDSLHMVVGAGDPDTPGEAWRPGKRFLVGAALFSRATRVTMDADSPVAVIARNAPATGRVEYLDAVNPASWVPIDTDVEVRTWPMTPSPGDADLHLRDFAAADTADWDTRDVFVYVYGTKGGSPVKGSTQITTVTKARVAVCTALREDDPEKAWEPGKGLLIEAFILDDATRLAPTAGSAVVYRREPGTGRLQYLDVASPGTWEDVVDGSAAKEWVLTARPDDAGVLETSFTEAETADWGTKDVVVAVTLERDGSKLQAFHRPGGGGAGGAGGLHGHLSAETNSYPRGSLVRLHLRVEKASEDQATLSAADVWTAPAARPRIWLWRVPKAAGEAWTVVEAATAMARVGAAVNRFEYANDALTPGTYLAVTTCSSVDDEVQSPNPFVFRVRSPLLVVDDVDDDAGNEGDDKVLVESGEELGPEVREAVVVDRDLRAADGSASRALETLKAAAATLRERVQTFPQLAPNSIEVGQLVSLDRPALDLVGDFRVARKAAAPRGGVTLWLTDVRRTYVAATEDLERRMSRLERR